MSKFPWEQADQKKGAEPNDGPNTAPGTPPFAAGAPISDLFQKAFSGAVIQETGISPLPPENNSSLPPSAGVPPLFSMEMPDFTSLQSDQKTPGTQVPPFIMNAKQESTPPFLFQEPPMGFSAAAVNEVKDASKPQTAKKKLLPLFEMPLTADDAKSSDFTPPTINSGAGASSLSMFSASGPNLNGSAPFTLPAFPASTENILSPPFSQSAPGSGGIVPFPQNIAQSSVQHPPFPSFQAPAPSTQPDVLSGSGNPFGSNPSDGVAPAFPGGSSPFDVPGNSPFSGNPSSTDPFSTSGDPFGNTPVSSSADPFAGQGNPFGAGPVPPGPVPFPAPGVTPPFAGDPFQGSVTARTGKRTGISEKVADVSGKLTTSISELANSIVSNLRNLTKGKSLMEKIEKIREGNIREEDNALQLPEGFGSEGGIKQSEAYKSVSGSEASPFGPGFPGASPFAPSAGEEHPAMSVPHSSQAGIVDVQAMGNIPDDFVKVTPVENPLYDFPEELKIDNNAHSAISTGENIKADTGGEMNATVNSPVSSAGKLENMNPEIPSLPASMKQRPPSTLYQPGKTHEEKHSMTECSDSSLFDTSKELSDMREKLELSTGNVSQVYGMFEELSGSVTVMGDVVRSLQSSSDDVMQATAMKFDNMDERVGQMESRLSGIEQQVSNVQSENKNIMSSLSSIEQHISELLESYTALVSKIQETAQENDERLSGLSGKIGSIENLAPRLASMGKSSAEMSAGVQDLAGSVSKLATDVSGISASQQQIRDEMAELSKYAEGELKKIGARGYKVAGQSIQLAHIMKNSTSIKLCMEWLEFLMELVGRNNLPDILSYYEELGWITEEVRMELMRYAEGIDFYMEKPDWKLTPDDHVKSIWFIENLAGIKVDKNKLSVIDRDIEKVRKSSEIYNI
jgi:archaellum component FlaD/FlaE